MTCGYEYSACDISVCCNKEQSQHIQTSEREKEATSFCEMMLVSWENWESMLQNPYCVLTGWRIICIFLTFGIAQISL